MNEVYAQSARFAVEDSRELARRDSANALRRVFSAQKGYDVVAPYYDAWHWQEFWKRNEHSHVLRWVSAGGQYVDIGCGTGAYCEALLSLGTPLGVDPSAEMIALARRRLSDQVQLRLGSIRDLPMEHASVDFSLTARVLSHESDLDRAASEVARVTRLGGTWVITDVHSEHPYPCTRIPTPRGDVYIETYKRSPDEIEAVVLASGQFELVESQVFRASDLDWLPDDPKFARVDRTGRRPVFFVQVFRRV